MKTQTENAGHMYIKKKHNCVCIYQASFCFPEFLFRFKQVTPSSSIIFRSGPLCRSVQHCQCCHWHMNMRSQTNFLWTLILVDIQQLETHMKNKQQKEQETRDPLIGQLQQTIDNFQSSTDQLTNNITSNIRAEVQHQIQMMVGKWVSQCQSYQLRC